MGTGATVIHLEVRLDGESPVGRAYDDGGRTQQFAGWMALVALIDDFLTAAPRGTVPPWPQERTPS